MQRADTFVTEYEGAIGSSRISWDRIKYLYREFQH